LLMSYFVAYYFTSKSFKQFNSSINWNR
jgi:hypothetical protein